MIFKFRLVKVTHVTTIHKMSEWFDGRLLMSMAVFGGEFSPFLQPWQE
jgi:hypothetical protein